MQYFTVLIALGSNKPFWRHAPAGLVERAARAVGRLGREMALSPLYRSDAWPDPAAPAYVNAVLKMKTPLGPEELLAALLTIEAGFGRRRSDDPALRYAPRPLDLDLLDHGGREWASETLELPHPRLEGRAFVLAPLLDVAPGWRHPVTDVPGRELLDRAEDRVARLPFTGS